MHQPGLGGSAQRRQGLLAVQGVDHRVVVEGRRALAEDHADVQRVLAGLADQGFLGAADAVDHAPGLGLVDDLAGAFEGLDRQVGVHALVDRQDAVESRLHLQGLGKGLAVVILEQLRQFGVDAPGLRLVDADHERHQGVAQPAAAAPGVDQPLARHALEQRLQGGGVERRGGIDRRALRRQAFADLLRRFQRQAQLSRQGGFFRVEEMRQQAQLGAIRRRREAVRQRIQPPGQLLVWVIYV